MILLSINKDQQNKPRLAKDIIAYIALIVDCYRHYISLSLSLISTFFKHQKGNIQVLRNSIPSLQNFPGLRLSLRKIAQFHLISWCGNFVEKHSFLIVSGKSLETMRKLCLSAKFLHQELGEITLFFAVCLLRTLSNINDKAFCENRYRLKTINYFSQNASSQILQRALNTPLNSVTLQTLQMLNLDILLTGKF